MSHLICREFDGMRRLNPVSVRAGDRAGCLPLMWLRMRNEVLSGAHLEKLAAAEDFYMAQIEGALSEAR